MAKTRNSKVFVESRDAAMELARSVADVADQKSRAKVQVHQAKARQVSTKPPTSQDKRATSSKARLERAKTALAAQAAHAKREKAKLRKKGRASAGPEVNGADQGDSKTKKSNDKPPKKRVTFG
ncbi:hypothetical protein C2E23DRAFT_881052 [Lenzites betulinus]|nr:hypothetical protein C2E23DRAFT_881052 [Lenzites betulinus]